MHPLTTALAILVAVNGVVCGPLLGLPGLSDVSTPSVAMTVSIGGSGSNKESAGEGSEDTSSVRGASHWISSGRSEAADINQQGKEGSYSNVDHWISGLQDFLKKGASAVGAETSDWKARLNEYIRTSDQPKEDTASIVDPGHWTGGVTELLGTQRKESTSHELGGGSWNTGHKESIGVSEQHQEGTLSASNPISLNADHVGSRSTSEIRHIGTTVDSSPTSWNAGHKDSIVISERRNEDTRSDPNPVTRREGQKESVSITEHRVEGSSLETHPASTWSAGPKESVVTEHQNKEESAFNVGRKDSTGVQETRESVSHFDSGSHVQSSKLAFGKRDKDSSDSSESSSKPRRRPGFGISTDQERGKESSVLEYVPVQKHTAQQPLRESSDGHYGQTQEASQSQIISYSSKRDDEASESRDPRRGTGETTEQSSGRSTSSSSSSIYRQSYPGANQQSGVGSEGRYGQPQGGSRGGYESISSRGRDDEASEGRDTGRRTGETAPSISAGSSLSSSSSRQSYTGSSLQRGENPQAVYDQAQQGGRGEYQSSSSWRREEGPSEGRDTQRGEGETTRSSSSYSSSTSVERSQSYPNSESRTDGIQRIRDPSDGNANLASSSQSYTAQEGRAVVVRGREEPSTNDGYVSSTVTKSSVASSVEGGRRTAVAPIQERDSGLISTEGFSKTLNGNGEYKSANPELALSVPLPLGGTTSLSLDMGKVDPGHDIIQWDANLHW